MCKAKRNDVPNKGMMRQAQEHYFLVKLSVLSVLVVRKNQIRNTQMSGRLTALAINLPGGWTFVFVVEFVCRN